jgi:hypothetical protein
MQQIILRGCEKKGDTLCSLDDTKEKILVTVRPVARDKDVTPAVKHDFLLYSSWLLYIKTTCVFPSKIIVFKSPWVFKYLGNRCTDFDQ